MTPDDLYCWLEAVKAFNDDKRLNKLNDLPNASLQLKNQLVHFNNQRKSLAMSINFKRGLNSGPSQEEIERSWAVIRGRKIDSNSTKT